VYSAFSDGRPGRGFGDSLGYLRTLYTPELVQLFASRRSPSGVMYLEPVAWGGRNRPIPLILTDYVATS